MRTVNSSVFQRTYHTLTEPTAVTRDGVPLGTWLPAGTREPVSIASVLRDLAPVRTPEGYLADSETGEVMERPTGEPLKAAWTPAPKPGKRKPPVDLTRRA